VARPQAPRLAVDLGVEFDVAEQCLAHSVGNSVTRAYLRTMPERRRKVMADWAAFLAGKSADNVITFKGTRPAPTENRIVARPRAPLATKSASRFHSPVRAYAHR
jgi:hypothetical protein